MTKRFVERLRSPRPLIRRIVDEYGHYVYAYLRDRDSKTAHEGSPYYIGIANNRNRPFVRHRRGNGETRERDVPIPKDERFIQVLHSCASREEAIEKEIRLVSRYGRKGIDKGGILLNRTLGGEGVTGLRHAEDLVERMRGEDWTRRLRQSQAQRSEMLAQKYEIPLDAWNGMPRAAKNRIYWRYLSGIKMPELIADKIDYTVDTAESYEIDQEAYAQLTLQEKYVVRSRFQNGYRGEDLLIGVKDGISLSIALKAKEMEVDASLLDGLSKSERGTLYRRYNRGVRGKELFDYLGQSHEARSRRVAENFGISFAEWDELTRTERNCIKERYRSGYRGEDLVDGVKDGLSITVVQNAKELGLEPSAYAALTFRERATVRKRYRNGVRGKALLEHLHGSGTKAMEAAKKYGLTADRFAVLTKSQKLNLAQRYRRGARGEKLFDGLGIDN